MAIQFRTPQYKDDSVTADKIHLQAGTYDFGSGSALLRCSAPVGSTDAANKAYVDGVLQGAFWKDACEVATTANITLSGTQTIDGIAVTANDRVLVKDQTDAKENGIYVCAAGAWSRADDMDADAEFPGSAVFIKQGTVSADLGYVCTNDSVTVGSTDISFTQFTGLGQVTAGDGLQKSGNEISVDLKANSGLEISGTELAAKINTAAGLEFGASGAIQAKLKAASGLGFESGTGNLEAKIDTAKGVVFSSGAIAVNLDTSYGLDFSSGAIRVILASAKGLSFDASGDLQTDLGGALDYNSGAIEVQVDNSTIEIDSNNLQVKDNSLGLAKQSWRPVYEEFTGQSGTSVSLTHAVNANFLEGVCVFRNGQRLRANPSPSDNTEYSVAANGTITFGAALESDDLIQVDYIK